MQLTQKYFEEITIEARKQKLLKQARAEVCLAESSDRLAALEKSLKNSLLSQERICLGPRVVFDEEGLIKTISKTRPEIDMPVVRSLKVAPIDSFPRVFSVPFSQIEASKWSQPYLVCTRDERGPEMMALVLQPLRSNSNLGKVKPIPAKWTFGLIPYQVSFARVALRIFDREVDGERSAERVFVIFLDDHRKMTTWTSESTRFYEIPKDFNFKALPAFTFHVWLCGAEHSWANYGSIVRIPLSERKGKIKEFIAKFKSYDGPEPNCCVRLSDRRGSEPWAFVGDVFVGIAKDKLEERVSGELRMNSVRHLLEPVIDGVEGIMKKNNVVLPNEIDTYRYSEATKEMSQPLMETAIEIPEVKKEINEEIAVDGEQFLPQEERVGSVDLTDSDDEVEIAVELEDIEPEEEVHITYSDDEDFSGEENAQKAAEKDHSGLGYSYDMDEFECWANADELKTTPMLEEDGGWPGALSMDHGLLFRKTFDEVLEKLEIGTFDDMMDQTTDSYSDFYKYFFGEENAQYKCRFNMLFDHRERLISERILWETNTSSKLRLGMTEMAKVDRPDLTLFFETVEMPCSFGLAYLRLARFRHERVIGSPGTGIVPSLFDHRENSFDGPTGKFPEVIFGQLKLPDMPPDVEPVQIVPELIEIPDTPPVSPPVMTLNPEPKKETKAEEVISSTSSDSGSDEVWVVRDVVPSSDQASRPVTRQGSPFPEQNPKPMPPWVSQLPRQNLKTPPMPKISPRKPIGARKAVEFTSVDTFKVPLPPPETGYFPGHPQPQGNGDRKARIPWKGDDAGARLDWQGTRGKARGTPDTWERVESETSHCGRAPAFGVQRMTSPEVEAKNQQQQPRKQSVRFRQTPPPRQSRSMPINTEPRYDHNQNRESSSDDSKHPYGHLRTEFRDRRGAKPSSSFPMRPSRTWRSNHPHNVGHNVRPRENGVEEKQQRPPPPERKERKQRFFPKRPYGFKHNQNSLESDRQVEFGDIKEGKGTDGWDTNYQPKIKKLTQNQEETAFQLPTWDVQRNVEVAYTLRVRNLSKWSAADIEEMFAPFHLQKASRDDKDWLVVFTSKADADSAKIVNGTQISKKKAIVVETI